MSGGQMVWKTKDGERVSIGNMTDSHLDNTIKYLRRHGYCTQSELDMCWAGLASLSPDSMASYYAEQETVAMKPLTILAAMEEEQARRNRRRNPEPPLYVGPDVEEDYETGKDMDQYYGFFGWGDDPA